MAVSIPARELYIGGRWVPSLSGKYLDVISPTTEAVIGRIPAGTAADVDLAVEAAAAVVKSGTWTNTTGKHRAEILRAMAQKYRDMKTVLAQYETMDCGKPIDEAEWDMDDVAGCFDYYAGLADKLDERQNSPIDVGSADFDVRVRREPLGVVALITPWNYPNLMAAWKVAPALAAGNCLVLKPSELASVTCLEMGIIAQEVGLPAGVLNIITGLGADAGARLSSHPGVSKVAFTGSVETGRRVNLAAAANLRPTTMELGGKSALIVFEDADIEKSVEWAMFGSMWTNGQICSATSRLLVHESIAEAFTAQLKRRAEAIKICCDPLEHGSRMGPLVSGAQYAKVLDYVKVGSEEGAVLLTGGKRPAHISQGYFLAPTIFVGVQPHMRIWREEIFGPVLSVATFKTEQEAVSAANASEYGLGGAVISKDLERCRRVAEALEVGIVWINCSQPAFCQAPWGGIKNSGHGRELGEWGLENFMAVKQLTTYTSASVWEWYSPPSAAKL